LKSLIIHPTDASTDFLRPIYKNVTNSTLITGNIIKAELLQLAHEHDRVMMMGHGSPQGLFAVNQFPDEGHMTYIVDQSFIPALKNKDNIFIWCHANKFVETHQLNGFYSGMFISELPEARMYDYDVEEEIIYESNDTFSEIVSAHANKPGDIIYKNVIELYGELAEKNPIARFNFERIYKS
jgi:hypothetical protein